MQSVTPVVPVKAYAFAVVVAVCCAGLAWAQSSQTARPKPGPQFGDPLPNLTDDELEAFFEGLAEFSEEDSIAEGLGPIFNDVSCAACHSSPAVGGASAILETRFGRTSGGNFDPLTELGGSLLQLNAIDPLVQESVPPEANVVAQRQSTPLFGAGLIEAIPDQHILTLAQQAQKNGVGGRAALVLDVATGQMRVGRFGWKAQQATLLAFSADAYVNEMGITSRLFPHENAPNGNAALLAQYDTVADPEDQIDEETGKANIDSFADFMRLLGPPPTLDLTDSAKAGKQLFNQIGCASCHVPSLKTGPSRIAALNAAVVPLFSDLLLHDMGALGDGIAQADATEREMRTAPLWGLRVSAPYLHDGRAATVEDAIRAHDGEAATARANFQNLSSAQRLNLLDYLNSI